MAALESGARGRFERRFGFCRLGIDEIATHCAQDRMTAMEFFVRSRNRFSGAVEAGHAHRNGPGVEKGVHRGRQPWRLCSRLGYLGASDREQRVDVSERVVFPTDYHLFPSVGCRADANQRFVIYCSSRPSRMGFCYDDCQGQDFEHRSVVDFSREIGVFRRPVQKSPDSDCTEPPWMARREVAGVYVR
jgi:hypothetical protein